jgi:hypothetical protein
MPKFAGCRDTWFAAVPVRRDATMTADAGSAATSYSAGIQGRGEGAGSGPFGKTNTNGSRF